MDLAGGVEGIGELTGLLAESGHVDEKFGEFLRVLQSAGKGSAIGEIESNLAEAASDGQVGARLFEEADSGKQGEAIVEKRGQGAGDASGIGVGEDRAGERDLEREGIEFFPLHRILPGDEKGDTGGDEEENTEPPPLADEFAARDQDLGGHGHGPAAASEEIGELRDHDQHEDENHADPCDDEKSWVNQGLRNLIAKAGHSAKMRGQIFEDGAERAARFTGANETGIHIIEAARHRLHGGGKRLTVDNGGAEIFADGLEFRG